MLAPLRGGIRSSPILKVIICCDFENVVWPSLGTRSEGYFMFDIFSCRHLVRVAVSVGVLFEQLKSDP